jgi:hypothetical protein
MSRKTSTTSAKPASTDGGPIGDPKAFVAAYLAAEASADDVGTFEFPTPFVTEDGTIRIHSRHLLRWAKKQKGGSKVEKSDVQAALRSLGMPVKPRAIPGFEKALGFYTGKPKGVSVKGLPVRKRRAAKVEEAA